MTILVLDNCVRNYKWGSRDAIAQLQGRTWPTEQPEAELWMGAHPSASSQVDGRTLTDLIAEDPVGYLGTTVARRYQNQLPFLFKILAAERPLSIQAHPNQAQARAGFERENLAGVPLDARHRNYKDSNHKPEVVCAISEFWALNGFRPISEIVRLLTDAGLSEIQTEIHQLTAEQDAGGLQRFFRQVMKLSPERRQRVLDQALGTAHARCQDLPEYDWMVRLADAFPDDLGILSVLMLNLVALQPGEAMFCPAGSLHAYLGGFCVELMANSDNVLRGGLTRKHIDLDELMNVLTFDSGHVSLLDPVDSVYSTAASEFELQLVRPGATGAHRVPNDHGFEILTVIQGQGRIRSLSDDSRQDLATGDTIAVTADARTYEITGDLLAYKASVGPFG